MRSFFDRHAPVLLGLGLLVSALAASCGSADDKKKIEDAAGGDAAGGSAPGGGAPRGGSAGRPGSAGSGGRAGELGFGGAAAAGVGTSGEGPGAGGDNQPTGGTGVSGDNGGGAGGGAGDNGAGAGGVATIPLGCGDGVKNNAEDCDGSDLGFAACYSKVTNGAGALGCHANCTFDFAACCAAGTLCLAPAPACVDTMTDEANCGACGTICPGADQCSRGRCVTALGHNITSPTGISVDATNVYYLNAGDTFVYSVPKAGGSAPVAISSVGGGVPDQILEVGSTLYWTNTNGFKVMQVANTGGTGTAFSGTEAASPTGLATNGSSLFWTLDTNPGSVRTATLPSGGAAASTNVSGAEVVNPKRVAVTASYIVVANAGTNFNGSVYRYDLNGANKTLLASGLGPTWGLCADATSAYFSSSLDNKVWSVPLDASASAVALSSAEAYPWDIVCDGADLYWVNSNNGQVRKMKKTGGAVSTIAQSGDLSGTGWYLGDPKHLAVDGTYLYWTDQGTQYGGGGVFRVSKN